MNTLISVALLVIGLILVTWGVSAAESFSSDISRFFTGTPNDLSIWLLIGGIVVSIAGLAVLLTGAKRNRRAT